MKRAIIIGSPGTGKSTFAKQLTQKTGLPLVHIDYYYHDPTKIITLTKLLGGHW